VPEVINNGKKKVEGRKKKEEGKKRKRLGGCCNMKLY